MGRNIHKKEASTTNVTLSSGDGTQAVVFNNPFQETPAVICGFAETLGSGKRGFVAAASITIAGFTITVDSDSVLSDVDVSWFAMEKRSGDRD